MKQKLSKALALVFLTILCSQSLSAQGWWYKKANYNQSARTAAVGFAIGIGGYVGTGFDSASFKRNFSVYDQTTDTWFPVQSFGGTAATGLARDAAVASVVGVKAYIGLGQGSNPFFGDFWEFDSGSNTWSQKANFGGTARRSAAAFSVNNKCYVVCGQDITGFKNDLWMYDPSTNLWTQKTAFPGTARRLPVAFVIGDKAYVGTGDDGTFKSDFYEYNATIDTWTMKTSFAGTPRYGAAAFALGTDGYVGTGYDNTLSNRNDFWKYNSITDTWTQVKDFSGGARSNAVAFSIGNKGYFATGYDTLAKRDLWEYDPLSNGIEEINKFKNSLTIFPNPMNSTATIVFDTESLNAFDKISFVMYDMNGKEVKQINMTSSNSVINRDGLASGLYAYKFIGGNFSLASGKIIIQ